MNKSLIEDFAIFLLGFFMGGMSVVVMIKLGVNLI